MLKRTMTVSELIAALERKEPDEQVRFDFAYFFPSGLHSYRGDYSQLAIGYESGYPSTTNVGRLLAILKDAIGKEFTGWKGGEFIMHDDTPVWVSEPNEGASTGIVDVRENDPHGIVLVTALIDD